MSKRTRVLSDKKHGILDEEEASKPRRQIRIRKTHEGTAMCNEKTPSPTVVALKDLMNDVITLLILLIITFIIYNIID